MNPVTWLGEGEGASGACLAWGEARKDGVGVDIYFLDKGALIIGFADKRPLIQRAF